MKLAIKTLIFTLMLFTLASAQQMADTSFLPEINNPTWESGSGPTVMIDEAHNNFHTASGRYLPFAQLLRRDGYTVEPFKQRFTKETLKDVDILVIANALHPSNVNDWSLPTLGAFSMLEAGWVQKWVKAGGSLLFITDHMPFPGAALELGKAFKVAFHNGFAMDTLKTGPTIFRTSDSTLLSHPVVTGRDSTERVDSIATWTGQAFFTKIPNFVPLMVFDSGYVSLTPQEAWEFDENTGVKDVEGWFQGGVMELGKGRVAIFGEAAMFTAQVVHVEGEESRKAGMNAPQGAQNTQFLLNVMRWLSRKI